MSTLLNYRIRIAAEVASLADAVDVLKAGQADENLKIRGGDAVRVEVAFLDVGEPLDISDVTAVNLEIKPTATVTSTDGETVTTTQVAPTAKTAPLVRKTLAAELLNDALTKSAWDAGGADDAHAVFTLSSAETRLASGARWLSIGVVATGDPAAERVVASGPIEILGGGLSGGSPSGAVAEYYTKAESSALFSQRSNNLSDLGSVATARTNLGLVVGADVQVHAAKLDAIVSGNNDTIGWAEVDKSGSSLADLASRSYGDLTGAPDVLTVNEAVSRSLRLHPGLALTGEDASAHADLEADALRSLLFNVYIPSDLELTVQAADVGLLALSKGSSAVDLSDGGTTSGDCLVGYLLKPGGAGVPSGDDGAVVIRHYNSAADGYRELKLPRSLFTAFAGMQVCVALVLPEGGGLPDLYLNSDTNLAADAAAVVSTTGTTPPVDWAGVARDHVWLGRADDATSTYRGALFGELYVLNYALSAVTVPSHGFTVQAFMGGATPRALQLQGATSLQPSGSWYEARFVTLYSSDAAGFVATDIEAAGNAFARLDVNEALLKGQRVRVRGTLVMTGNFVGRDVTFRLTDGIGGSSGSVVTFTSSVSQDIDYELVAPADSADFEIRFGMDYNSFTGTATMTNFRMDIEGALARWPLRTYASGSVADASGNGHTLSTEGNVLAVK